MSDGFCLIVPTPVALTMLVLLSDKQSRTIAKKLFRKMLSFFWSRWK